MQDPQTRPRWDQLLCKFLRRSSSDLAHSSSRGLTLARLCRARPGKPGPRARAVTAQWVQGRHQKQGLNLVQSSRVSESEGISVWPPTSRLERLLSPFFSDLISTYFSFSQQTVLSLPLGFILYGRRGRGNRLPSPGTCLRISHVLGAQTLPQPPPPAGHTQGGRNPLSLPSLPHCTLEHA